MIGARTLRHAGPDTFIPTRDVTYALEDHYDVMTDSRHSKTGRRQAQEAFLEWHANCGRPLARISMVLACDLETQ